jgi:hypothetical protein
MSQQSLFNLEEIFDRPLELFFSILDLSSLDKASLLGRKPTSKSAMTKALIFKNLRSIANLSDLSAELFERPALASILGFEPGDKPIPIERFYFSSFVKEPNKIRFVKSFYRIFNFVKPYL